MTTYDVDGVYRMLGTKQEEYQRVTGTKQEEYQRVTGSLAGTMVLNYGRLT